MYIRKTKIKSGPNGEPYYSYRLVESVRKGKTVRQKTILNLGKYFAVEPEHWPALTARIEQIIEVQSEQTTLFDLDQKLGEALESIAQSTAALIIHKYAQPLPSPANGHDDSAGVEHDFHTIDINHLEVLDPRAIGGETLACQAIEQLQLTQKLEALGFNGPQRAAALGSIVGRMLHPGSERDTHRWLQQNTALGELIDYDFKRTSLTRLYLASDQLLKHQTELESFLYRREQSLFQLKSTLILYDLTNTYFEGQAQGNPKAAFGRSKEKRSDCPLVTLALVLDGEGFPMRSHVFAGNASEPNTLQAMVEGLRDSTSDTVPTVVLDAGIATQDNLDWLKAHSYHYIVVSRERFKEKPLLADKAVVVKSDEKDPVQVIAKRVDCPDSGEVRLYCHSTLREKKDSAIQNRFTQRFEAGLNRLNEGLGKKGTVKRYDKIMERIGRLKQKNTRVASGYDIDVTSDEKKEKALKISWQRNSKASERDEQAGVYCLRTNITSWSELDLWQTYVMLTEIESSFRSMKTELGMRPVFHQKESRVTGHLFITLLAYHLVQSIRYQLKEKGIQYSWQSIRNLMSSQQRVTLSMPTKEGVQIYLRTTSRAEGHQQRIYEALGISGDPIGRRKMSSEDVKQNL